MKVEEQRAVYTATQPKISTEWPIVPFEQAATPQSDRGKRIKQRDYLPEGRIPVIDQGQTPIGGYTNNDDFAFSGELPVVLFGDHTRAVKLVDHRFAVGADGIKIFRPADGVRPKYLYYWMKSARIPDRGYGRHYQYLRQLSVPLPLPNKQDEIVAEIEKQFSRLDEAVANLKRVKANLKRYKAAVLKAAVEGKLTEAWRKQHPDTEPASELLQRILAERRAKWEQAELAKMKAKGKPPKDDAWKKKYPEPAAPDTTDLPELPEGWVWANLGQLAWSVKDGPHYSPKYQESGVPFISGGNIRPEGINFSKIKFISPELHAELSERCKPELGDLLYTKGGTTGIARVNTESRDFNVWVHVAVLKLVDSINRFYLQHTLNSPYCYRQSQKYTHGVGNQDLGLTRMVKITIPLPPPSEQQAIVQAIERNLSIAEEAEAQVNANLQRAERLRQSILSFVFTSGDLG